MLIFQFAPLGIDHILIWRKHELDWVASLESASVVYNRDKVHIHQNFLKFVVHVIIIDQWNQPEP